MLAAKKVEAISIRCPVQRTKIKTTKKEHYNVCGEETTYQGTYSNVTFRSMSEMPLISNEGKELIHKTKPPQLSDEWTEANGSDSPLFWSESKPIALWCALLDDFKVQAIFDVTPGSGALMEAAMTRGVQYYGVCQGLSSEWVRLLRSSQARTRRTCNGSRPLLTELRAGSWFSKGALCSMTRVRRW